LEIKEAAPGNIERGEEERIVGDCRQRELNLFHTPKFLREKSKGKKEERKGYQVSKTRPSITTEWNWSEEEKKGICGLCSGVLKKEKTKRDLEQGELANKDKKKNRLGIFKGNETPCAHIVGRGGNANLL